MPTEHIWEETEYINTMNNALDNLCITMDDVAEMWNNSKVLWTTTPVQWGWDNTNPDDEPPSLVGASVDVPELFNLLESSEVSECDNN